MNRVLRNLKKQNRTKAGVAVLPLSIALVFAAIAVTAWCVVSFNSAQRTPAVPQIVDKRLNLNTFEAGDFALRWLKLALDYGVSAETKHLTASSWMAPAAVKEFSEIFWTSRKPGNKTIIFMPTTYRWVEPDSPRKRLDTAVLLVNGVFVSLTAGEIHNYQSMAIDITVRRKGSGVLQIESFKIDHFRRKNVRWFLADGYLQVDRDFEAKHERDLGVLVSFCRGQDNLISNELVFCVNEMNFVIQQAPWFGLAYARRGFALGELGDLTRAKQDCEMAVKLSPQSGIVFFYRALMRESWDKSGALDDYTKAMSLDPGCFVYVGNRAFLRYQLKDLDGAITDGRAAILVDRSVPYLRANLAEVLAEKGLIKEAIAEYDSAIRLEPTAFLYKKRAMLKQEIGDLRGCIEDATEVIRLNDLNVGAYIIRGEVLEDLDDDAGAIRDYAMAIGLNPKCFTALHRHGMALERMGKSKEALVDYDQAIEAYPEGCGPRIGRSNILFQLKDEKSAFEEANRHAQMHPQESGVYCCRGRLFRLAGENALALRDMNQAISLKATNPIYRSFCYCERAVVKTNMGKLKEAIQDYDSAVELDKKSWLAFNNRAYLKRLTGDLTGAAADQMTAWKLQAAKQVKQWKMPEFFSRNFM